MKRILLLALAALPMLAAAAFQVPYYTDMGSTQANNIDPDWKVVNGKEGTSTWTYDNTDNLQTAVTDAKTGVVYKYDSKNAADDWLISPAIALKAGDEYKVSYWMKTSGSNEDMGVYLASSDTPEGLLAGKILKDYKDYKNSTWHKETVVFTVASDGDYHVGFFIHSPANRYNVFLRGFTLGYDVIVPAAVSDLTATVAPDNEMKVTLNWALPTLDTDGNPLTNPISSVIVMRGGVEIATLAGTATSFEDTPETGLTNGFQTYEVKVTCDGQTSKAKSVQTAYVGEVQPLPLPYSYDFQNADMWELWTVIDPDGDAKPTQNPAGCTWSRWANTVLTGYMAVFSNPTSAVAENDWLITPPLEFLAPGKYYVGFNACIFNSSNYSCLLDLRLGSAANPESMPTELAQFTTFDSKATYPKDGAKIEVPFEVEKAGTYYIGFYEHGNAARREVRITNFYVKPDPSILVGIENVEKTQEYVISGNTITFAGEDFTTISTASGKIVVNNQPSSVVDLSGFAKGLYFVRHGQTTVKIMVK